MRIYSQPLGSLTEYILTNPATGDCVAIVPAHGGIIRWLKLHKDGVEHEVIQAGKDEKSFLAERGAAGMHLFPWPSRIQYGRYSFAGKDYQLAVNEQPRQNAIHGLVQYGPFEVTEEFADPNLARLTIRHRFKGVEGYPFPFELDITHEMTPDGRLTLAYAARNTGKTAMPLGLGWHPYFHLDEPIDTMQLAFPAEAAYFLDNQMIPVAKDFFLEAKPGFSLNDRVLDTPYAVYRDSTIATTQLTSPTKVVTVNVWQEVGEGKFNFVVIYTPPRRNRIAIEPMTCNVNAFNSGDGLVTLEPGQSWGAKCGVFLS
jgi:aldose 1-epimerase